MPNLPSTTLTILEALDHHEVMVGKTLWGEPTERRATWLRDIFLRLGGKIT
jgi:hypothetical protein